MSNGPFELVVQIAAIFDSLEIPYALGGSVASSFYGEPRSTVDVDFAASLTPEVQEQFYEQVRAEFYVPIESARTAVTTHSSFNLLDTHSALKVDIFVLGPGVLDQMQIERRVRFAVSGSDQGIWVTSPEDQVLRKLDWYRLGGGVSDRQWRDVASILKIQAGSLDMEYLHSCAALTGLSELLEAALTQSQ